MPKSLEDARSAGPAGGPGDAAGWGEEERRAVTGAPAARAAASVIVLAWNAWEHTRACLASLGASAGPDDEVIVVDNGSTDGTAAGLAAMRVDRLITNEVNAGFAAGANQGAAVASREILVFLNNDTVVPRGWLEALLAPFADPQVVATGPRSNFVAGRQLVQPVPYDRAEGELFEQFVRRFSAEHAGRRRETDGLIGFCLAVRRSAFTSVGGFEEGYGLGNFEDNDLCHRLRRAGGRLLIVDDAFVHHTGHVSFRENGVDLVSLLRTNEERYRASWGALGPQRADPYAGPVAGSAQPADDPGRWSEPLRAAEAGADAAAVAATAPDVVLFAGTDREAALSSLASLRACTPGSRIVVVDDAAHLATPEWAQAVAGLEVLDGMGAGRAAGFNAGLEATATDEVCLVSSEVVVSRGWLDGLAAALASDDAVAAVGPVAPGLYGQSIDAAYLDLEEYGRLAAAYNHSDPSKWSRVLRLSDGCLLVRRSAVEKVGGLDENYTTGTLAGDDLCLRLLTGGFTLSRCADVLVHHRGTAVVQPGEARFAEIERLGFEARWGFSPTYSMIPRYEVVALLDRPGPLSVLELGCACGATLLEIANRFPGSEVHGLEFNERAAEVAACVAHARYGDAEAPLDYPAASFDYVICADVLEHLHEPWQVLAGLRPLLKPGGKVIASIPNLMHIGVLARLLRGRFTYEDAGILDRTHLRFFTLAEIDDMFAGAGYPSRSYTATRIPLGAAEAQLAESLAATFAVDQAQYLAYQYLVVAGV